MRMPSVIKREVTMKPIKFKDRARFNKKFLPKGNFERINVQTVIGGSL